MQAHCKHGAEYSISHRNGFRIFREINVSVTVYVCSLMAQFVHNLYLLTQS
jgi:hypothetical protein